MRGGNLASGLLGEQCADVDPVCDAWVRSVKREVVRWNERDVAAVFQDRGSVRRLQPEVAPRDMYAAVGSGHEAEVVVLQQPYLAADEVAGLIVDQILLAAVRPKDMRLVRRRRDRDGEAAGVAEFLAVGVVDSGEAELLHPGRAASAGDAQNSRPTMARNTELRSRIWSLLRRCADTTTDDERVKLTRAGTPFWRTPSQLQGPLSLLPHRASGVL